MPRTKHYELIGKKFSRLLVIAFGKSPEIRGQGTCICRCDCGNLYRVFPSHIMKKRGPIRSCGCLYKEKTIDKTSKKLGEKYGLLTVVEIQYVRHRRCKRAILICRCECGNGHQVATKWWGRIKSCGCLNFGEKHPKSKLTESSVKEIRKLYKIGYKKAQIARIYHVSSDIIDGVCRGRYYKSVK